jgi:hypothetical protein
MFYVTWFSQEHGGTSFFFCTYNNKISRLPLPNSWPNGRLCQPAPERLKHGFLITAHIQRYRAFQNSGYNKDLARDIGTMQHFFMVKAEDHTPIYPSSIEPYLQDITDSYKEIWSEVLSSVFNLEVMT